MLPPQSPEEARRRWGTREFTEEVVSTILPSFAQDESLLRWYGDYQRYAVSPSGAAEFFRMFYDTDITDVLTTIRVPTLVLYHPMRREAALGVTALVSGARAVEVRSDDLAIWANDEIPGEIERFLSGREESPVPDTVLTTVLFTDIVASTERAAALGDRAWAELVERHHALVRRELVRHRGTEVDTAGDGFFATFDGPARAIHCAGSVIEGARGLGIEIRAGVHTGECEVAAGKVAGIAVVIGARVSGLAEPGEVLATSTVKDLVAGSDIAFEERGEHELTGVPGARRLYAAFAGAP
jgi:class 3 adenylate cyclase